MQNNRVHIQVILAAALITMSLTPVRSSAQNRSPVAPSEQAFQAILREAYNKFKGDTSEQLRPSSRISYFSFFGGIPR